MIVKLEFVDYTRDNQQRLAFWFGQGVKLEDHRLLRNQCRRVHSVSASHSFPCCQHAVLDMKVDHVNHPNSSVI